MNEGRGNNNIIIMAAGMSSRMNLLNQNILPAALSKEIAFLPKCMVRVGKDQQPFLHYLLAHVHEAGYEDVLIIVNSNDEVVQHYCKGLSFKNMKLSFAAQKIPLGKKKPMGTADAVLQGLQKKDYWQGTKFTVCNADNLYSANALKKVKSHVHPCALIEYNIQSLSIPESRVSEYSIVEKDAENFVCSIMEKPSITKIKSVPDNSVKPSVNMNLYQFEYDLIMPYLLNCAIHPTRHEKELTTAVMNLIRENPQALYAISLSEQVLDLTYKSDIPIVNDKIK